MDGENSLGCQIDLLFDRAEGVITLYEFKYAHDPNSGNQKLLAELEKNSIFQSHEKTK